MMMVSIIVEYAFVILISSSKQVIVKIRLETKVLHISFGRALSYLSQHDFVCEILPLVIHVIAKCKGLYSGIWTYAVNIWTEVVNIFDSHEVQAVE